MEKSLLSTLIGHLSDIEAHGAKRVKEIEVEQNKMLVAILAQIAGSTVNDNVKPTDVEAAANVVEGKHPTAVQKRPRKTAKEKHVPLPIHKRGNWDEPVETAAPTLKDRDARVIDALTTRYQGPDELLQKLTSVGVIFKKPNLYGCMKRLAAKLPDLIEQKEKPLAWRIKGKATAPATDAPATARPIKAIAAGKGKGKATKAPRASNDGVVANDDAVIIQPTDVKAPLLIKGDGLAMLRGMADKSVDLFMLDLPYGTTGTTFDPKIDVEEWMYQFQRVVTDTGAILAFSVNPFTTDLIVASRAYDRGKERFHKDDLIWEKTKPTGFPQSHNRHMKAHENILVFSRGTVVTKSKRRMTYNPQGVTNHVRQNRDTPSEMGYLANGVNNRRPGEDYGSLEGCPRSVLYYRKDDGPHSFAKPVALLEYLTRTYSNPGDLIVDPTMGSGSAGVAALNTGRRFIGAENGFKKEGECIFSIAKKRIDDVLTMKAA